jgi:glycosyltransferase involved in cell wall biosynthesis
MALVEAMASGVPIITTDSGAIPRSEVGISAIVRPAKDIRSHIEAIDGVLSYRCNVLQLSRSGRARAERLYDIKKISAKLKTLY